ncbi:MAG: Mut7-C ubiquitin/RNAse domain-containing protein [Actinomycetota bacterium]|nr:twitching motility protein PilT [Euzebyaceae bacterium]MDQ3451844.1 Mut7-C ubiquitin/RNAse domain-containing protein [Actinomycetota bacterium]
MEVGYVGVEYGEVGHVAVRLYGDLADLAATGRPAPHHQVPVAAPRAVKDVIESLGVPHTEVDLVLVGGSSVAFAQRVIPGDRVSVYPQFADLDVATVSLVRPPPLPEPRFLLDVHLGALANRLRLLGLDAAYRNDAGDAELAATAAADERALLTRDRGLLMRANVVHGQLLRSHHPDSQALEVVRRFDLFDAMAPFSRCPRCGGSLAPVAKAAIVDRLQPGTAATYDTFTRCAGCQQVYWPGAHHDRLAAFVEAILAAGASARVADPLEGGQRGKRKSIAGVLSSGSRKDCTPGAGEALPTEKAAAV